MTIEQLKFVVMILYTDDLKSHGNSNASKDMKNHCFPGFCWQINSPNCQLLEIASHLNTTITIYIGAYTSHTWYECLLSKTKLLTVLHSQWTVAIVVKIIPIIQDEAYALLIQLEGASAVAQGMLRIYVHVSKILRDNKQHFFNYPIMYIDDIIKIEYNCP